MWRRLRQLQKDIILEEQAGGQRNVQLRRQFNAGLAEAREELLKLQTHVELEKLTMNEDYEVFRKNNEKKTEKMFVLKRTHDVGATGILYNVLEPDGVETGRCMKLIKKDIVSLSAVYLEYQLSRSMGEKGIGAPVHGIWEIEHISGNYYAILMDKFQTDLKYFVREIVHQNNVSADLALSKFQNSASLLDQNDGITVNGFTCLKDAVVDLVTRAAQCLPRL